MLVLFGTKIQLKPNGTDLPANGRFTEPKQTEPMVAGMGWRAKKKPVHYIKILPPQTPDIPTFISFEKKLT